MPRTRTATTKKKSRQQQRHDRQRRNKDVSSNNRNNSKKTPPTVDDLLQVGTTSMASMDIEIAYQAFRQAAAMLQQLQGPSSSSSSSSSSDDDMKLIQTLEKMGECQVSMGDPDLAREHFVEALEWLEREQQQNQLESMEGLTSSSSSAAAACRFLDTHSSLCLYIGQLSLEREALEAYLRGIRSLEQCIRQMEVAPSSSTGTGEETVVMMMEQEQASPPTTLLQLQDLKQKLSKAYCNVAELYLTDLCEEENAENDCQHYLEQALQILDVDGEPLVDALQTMASLRLSQQPEEKQLEAVPFILRAYEKQRVGSEALAALVGLNGADIDDDDDDEGGEGTTMKADKNEAKELLQLDAANNLPEFEFRCQTAKILLECAGLLKATRGDCDGDVSTASSASIGNCTQATRQQQEAECVSAAISVLGSLLAQNDEVVEIWYLIGCAFAAKFPAPLVDAARFYLDRAKEMLTEIRKSFQQEAQFADESEQDDVEEQLEMNTAQMSDVQAKLDELQDHDDATMEE